MRVNLRQIRGPWYDGWVLDKHTIRSVPIGENQQGHMQFETERTEVGESSFLLKYRQNFNQIPQLAQCLNQNILCKFDSVGMIIPMPASTLRNVQPVYELSKELSRISGIPYVDSLLSKAGNGKSLKDLDTFDEKIEAIGNSITLNPIITRDGKWNVLLVDDLFHTGASMHSACNVLSQYNKIGRIYVAALTWR